MRQAFSMVELLLAIVCLGIAGTGILACLRFSSDADALARQRVIILNRLASEVETTRSSAAASTLAAGTVNQSPTISGVPYSVTISRAVVAVPGKAGLFQVTATATWNTRTVSLQTFVENGVG